MAKVVFPSGMLLTGTLGNLVICRRGRTTYVRTRVTPNNPRSDAQVEHRGRFKEAVAAWRALSPEDKERFRERALWQQRTGYNLFISEHMSRSQEEGSG